MENKDNLVHDCLNTKLGTGQDPPHTPLDNTPPHSKKVFPRLLFTSSRMKECPGLGNPSDFQSCSNDCNCLRIEVGQRLPVAHPLIVWLQRQE